MILKGSRYEGQRVLSVTVDSAGHSAVAVFRQNITLPSLFQYYRVKAGDRFDIIAYRVLGRPDLWWVLADANPEVAYPDRLTTGSIIRVPMVP